MAAAEVALEGVRKHLERVALSQEREKALTALMAKQTSIYDTLHANPGKGLVVNINFKVEDPSARPPVYDPFGPQRQLQLRFLGVATSEPFELPEPTTGPALTPGAAGTGSVGVGWKGHTLSTTIRPVRADPNRPGRVQVVDSVEALVGHITTFGLPLAKVAGQLKRGQRVSPPDGADVQGDVVKVTVYGVQLLVTEPVAGAVSDALQTLGREELSKGIRRSKREIGRLQVQVDKAVGEGSITRWWRRRSFQVDPHILDSPRAHIAAAENYLEAGDLDSAWESARACTNTLALVRNQLYAYRTNDFSDPLMQDPLRMSSVIQ